MNEKVDPNREINEKIDLEAVMLAVKTALDLVMVFVEIDPLLVMLVPEIGPVLATENVHLNLAKLRRKIDLVPDPRVMIIVEEGQHQRSEAGMPRRDQNLAKDRVLGTESRDHAALGEEIEGLGPRNAIQSLEVEEDRGMRSLEEEEVRGIQSLEEDRGIRSRAAATRAMSRGAGVAGDDRRLAEKRHKNGKIRWIQTTIMDINLDKLLNVLSLLLI